MRGGVLLSLHSIEPGSTLGFFVSAGRTDSLHTESNMSNEPRVYTAPLTFPNPQRLRLLTHEKNIADKYEEVLLDMAPGGDQRSWQHARCNPFGEAPTLELGSGEYLSETPAIIGYLDLAHDGKRPVTGESVLDRPET